MLPRSFTSPKLAHESALLLFYCSIHEILSICHAGSWVSAAVFTLPHPRDLQHLSCWLINLSCCPYTTLSTRFTASVMLAHESPLQNLTLPYWRDSQHPSSWLMNPCYKTTLPYSRDSQHHHAGSKSLLLNWHCPLHEIHSICRAGSWISASEPTLINSLDSQHLSRWLMTLCRLSYTAMSTRFTASAILAHESLLVNSHWPIY
jgi:hypothetical protein